MCGETWFSDTQTPDPAICCFGLPKPTSSLTSLKRPFFRGQKEKSEVFTNLLSLCALEYWSTWNRLSFHFTRPEIFQGMLIKISKRQGVFH